MLVAMVTVEVLAGVGYNFGFALVVLGVKHLVLDFAQLLVSG